MSTAAGHSSPFLVPDVTLWVFEFPIRLWSRRFGDDCDDEQSLLKMQLTRWQLNLYTFDRLQI